MRKMIAVLVLMAATVVSGEQLMFKGKPSGRILASGSRRVFMMDADGKVLWEHPGANMTDCWMQQNGHVVFADGLAVTEVDPKTGKVVFIYKPSIPDGAKEKDGSFSCQPLKNGNILVAENSTSRILEVTRQGKIAFELKVEPFKKGSHHNLRIARKLANGNYLVCHSGAHIVREYTPRGKIVFKVETGNVAFSALRLKNGNTLVSSIDHITEFDSAGKSVWSFANTDIAGLEIRAMCGVNVLPNGNLMVGVYSAYKDGGQVGIFEITRNKKLVWYYANPKADKNMMSVQLLDANGRALPDTLR
ncbi:MAG: hypothetical protein K9M45_09550 [Kiritimatiellales bacterium]|nr:hypothetical protein [Kiritimatiellales bacterium]